MPVLRAVSRRTAAERRQFTPENSTEMETQPKPAPRLN